MRGNKCAELCMWRSQDSLWESVFPSTIWNLKTELKWPGLAAGAFVCWALLCRFLEKVCFFLRINMQECDCQDIWYVYTSSYNNILMKSTARHYFMCTSVSVLKQADALEGCATLRILALMGGMCTDITALKTVCSSSHIQCRGTHGPSILLPDIYLGEVKTYIHDYKK